MDAVERGKRMKIEIKEVPIEQTPGCYRVRYFVDVSFPGDRCLHSPGNFEHRHQAEKFRDDIRTGRFLIKADYVPPDQPTE